MSDLWTYYSTVKSLELWSSEENASDIDFDQQMYEMSKEEICPISDHTDSFRRISWNDFYQISNDGKQLVTESLSLNVKNKELSDGDVNRVIRTFPKLKCLAINSQKFTSLGWEHLISEVFPALETLSIDNEIRIFRFKNIEEQSEPNWREVMSKLTNLLDFKLKLIRTDKLFDAKCLQYLPKNLISFYFRDISGASYLEDIMKNLSEGTANQLNFLRIESDERKRTVIKAYKYIGQLKQLRGLNLSIRNYINLNVQIENGVVQFIELDYLCELDKLETLTYKFYKSDETTEVLQILSAGKFKNSLTRLRLISAELDPIGFGFVFNSYKNLESLQLVDTHIDEDHIKQIVQSIALMPHLKELIIENCHQIKCTHLGYIIENSVSLNRLTIDNGFNDAEKQYLTTLALQLSTDQRKIVINIQ